VLHRPGGRVDRVRLRYHSRPVPCGSPNAGPGRHERLELELAEPVAGAAPGQLAALMCGETIVGHGTITLS
jgi:tRNA-specific 2-thiouridylase